MLVVPTFADVDHYRRELAGGGAVFGVRVVAFSGLMREIARRAGVAGRPLSRLARERVAGAAIARVRLEALAASAATPGFVQALLRLVAELEEQRIEPGRWWAAHAGVGRARARPRRLRRGARAALRRLPRRPARDRAAATASCTTRRRSTRCASSPRAGARRRSSSTASTTCTALQRDAIETLAVHAGAPVTVSLAYEPGRAAFAGRGETFQELMALGPEHVELPPLAEHYARPALHALERTLFEPPASGRPDPGDALLLLEGGGERAEVELVAAHVARLIGERAFAPEDIAVVLREPREHAALLEQVFGELEIPYALDRTIAAGHTALGRGLVALLRCALLDGSADDLLAWLRTPGKLARPELADRLEQRARRGGGDGGAGARRCGRPTTPTSSCTSSTASRRRPATRPRCAGAWPPRRRAVRRAAPRRGARCSPAPRRSTRASPARCARRWASSSAWRPSTARSCRRPTSSRASCTTSRCAPATTGAPGSWPSRARARCAPAACARCLPLRPARGRLPAPGHARAVPRRRRAPRDQRRLRAAPAPARGPPRRRALPALRASPPPDRAARAQLARGRRRGRAVRALAVRRRRPRLLRPRAAERVERRVARRRRLRGRAGADRERGGAPRLAAGAGPPEPAMASLRDAARAARPQRARDLVGVGARGLRLVPGEVVRRAAAAPGGARARSRADGARRAGPPRPRGHAARAVRRRPAHARAPRRGPRAAARRPRRARRRRPISVNPERLRCGLRRLEADLVRYLEHAAHGRSAFAPREFELRFGGPEDPLPPAELADGELRLQGRIDRIDVAPTAARRSSTTTRARRRRRRPGGSRTRNLQLGLYLLALPQLLGLEAVGGLYQPLGRDDDGARAACCSTAPTPASRRVATTAWRRGVRGAPAGGPRRRAAGGARHPRGRARAPTRHVRVRRRLRAPDDLPLRGGLGVTARAFTAEQRDGRSRAATATCCSRPTPARARRPCWSSASSPRWSRTACAPARSSRSPSPRRRRASCARACARGCSSSASASARARPRRRGSRRSTASARGSCAPTRWPRASTRRSPCSTSRRRARRAPRPSRPRWPTFLAAPRADALDLAAGYTVDRLQRMVVAAHDELRSRGQTRPALPPRRAAPTPTPRAPRWTRACAAFAAELAGAGAGAAVDARARGARGAAARRSTPARAVDPKAREGGRNANALKTPAADAYRAALEAYAAARCADRRAVPRAGAGRRAAAGATPTPTRRPSARAAASTSTTSSCSRATCCAGEPGDRRRLPRALRADHGRRVPGHERRCSSSCSSCWRATTPARRRRAAVDLRLPPRRRRGLPRAPRAPGGGGPAATLATNFRSRPEILRALNARVRRRCTSDWVDLRPGPRRRRRRREPLVELLVTDADAWNGDAPGALGLGLPAAQRGRRPRRGSSPSASPSSCTTRASRRATSSCCCAPRPRWACYERALELAGPADAGGRRPRLVGAPAGPRPVPPARRAGQPARRGGAARAARLAAGRRCPPTRLALLALGRARGRADALGGRARRRADPRARGRAAPGARSARGSRAERERAPRAGARRAAPARRAAHPLRPARAAPAAAARGGWPTSTSCCGWRPPTRRGRPRRARLHRPGDRRARGRGARARRAGRARRPRRGAADDDPRRQGPGVRVVVVADLGRRGNRSPPDLLVSGDRVGLRLVGARRLAGHRAGLRRASRPSAARPTRPRSGASCTWR